MKRQSTSLLLSAFLFAAVAACGSSASTVSGEADLTQTPEASAGTLTQITYSDLGNVITVKGTSPFFEGASNLLMTNESNPHLHTPQSIVGNLPGIAATSVEGPNGQGPFQADFDVAITEGGEMVGRKVQNGQCIGIYVNNAGDKGVNLGAFSSCQESQVGPTRCALKIYPDAQACLAEQPRLVSVSYSDLGNVVTVKGQGTFFEGSVHVFLRNETNPSANEPVPNFPGQEFDSIADVEVRGDNGVSPFQADLDTGNPGSASVPKKGECIGVYQNNGGAEGAASLGAFKYNPDDLGADAPAEQQYFYDAAECLKH